MEPIGVTPVEERIDHEEAKRTAERWDGNERLYEEHGPPWSPLSRDAGKLARAYLALLTEHSALQRALEMEKLRNGAAVLREALKDAHTIAERREIIATLAATEPAQPEEEPDD